MKIIIVSGINLFSGGTLSIMKDALLYLSKNLSDRFEIIALVHDKNLYKGVENIKFVEFKDSRKSWLRRIYYEYFYFKKLSKQIKPYLWLSMHDMTPNVVAEKRAVYCHNPMPFYRMNDLEKKFSPKLRLFNLFYKYLYMINIKKNDYVIVQQGWIRKRFKKMFNINNIIVSYPNIEIEKRNFIPENKNSKKIFFYAAFPRVFKNFEIICEAAEYFIDKTDIEFVITIDGTENRYSEYLYKRYSRLENLKFIGLLSRGKVFEYYRKSEALIFPSKLETWGLPITEYKEFNKPIFLSDLEYARETIGNYNKVSFFNPNDKNDLILKLEKYLERDFEFEETTIKKMEKPFTRGWEEFFSKLLGDKV